MSNPLLSKSYVAAAAIPPARIVRLVSETTCQMAASATEASIGVSDEIDTLAGERLDVHVAGICFVTAGAAVAVGAMLTSDASGRAITAATAGNRIIGVALEPATAAGDRIRMSIAPSVL